MKTKSLISTIAAAATISLMAVNVSAADWSQASYADNDPNTVKIISQTDTGVTFTTTDTNTDTCKTKIALDKILADSADCSKAAKFEWTITYNGVSPEFKGVALSGGAYMTNANSEGYSIKPDGYDADKKPVWKNNKYSATDRLMVEEPLTANSEIVFTDTSYANIGANGIFVTISNLKVYDADGKELAQLANGKWLDENVPEETKVSVNDAEDDAPEIENTAKTTTETTVTEAPAEETTKQPVDDNTEKNVNTGDVSTTIAFGAIGLACAALVATRKRK